MPSPEQERMDAISDALARLVQQQRNIEARLTRLEAAMGLAPAPSRPPEPAATAPQPPPPVPQTASPPAAPPVVASSAEAPPRPRFETRMGLTLVNRIGVVTLVIGIAFFFKYAIDNQWIGPAARVILGVIAGLAALGFGDRQWRRREITFAQGISGAGIAILYVAFYAAFGFYRLVPYGTAFLMMALVTVGAAALSFRYAAQPIALLGLFGGYITPVLLGSSSDRPWALFGYVLLLDLGCVAIERARGWRGPLSLGFAATYLLYFAWAANRFKIEDRPAAVFFALVFCALFCSRSERPLSTGAQLLSGLALLSTALPKAAVFLPALTAIPIMGLLVAGIRGWPEAPLAALASFWIPYAFGHYALKTASGAGLTVGLLTVPFLLFLLWLPWRGLKSRPIRPPDLAIAPLAAAFYFGAAFDRLDGAWHAWMGAFAAVLAAAHYGLALALKRSSDPRPAKLYTGIALAFLTLAVPIQFAGFRITLAWALEGAALAWIGCRTADQRLNAAAAGIFALVFARLLTADAYLQPDVPIANARFLAFTASAIAMGLAWFWTTWNLDSPSLSLIGVCGVLEYLGAHVVLLWGLTLEVLRWAERTASPMDLKNVKSTAVSILFASYAVLLVASGVRLRSWLNRALGLTLIGVVVVKLYFYDVWQIGRMYRVAAFAALGMLLLLTSYLYSRYRASIESWLRDENTAGPEKS